MTKLQLEYEGSVKNVFGSKNHPDSLWFQFTDDYSVFDWGKMPDQIANKGKALSLIGTYLFDELKNPIFWQNLPNSPHLKKFDQTYLQERWQHSTYASAEGLPKTGLKSHFLSLTDENQKALSLDSLTAEEISTILPLMQVLRAEINRPTYQIFLQNDIYFYNQEKLSTSKRRFIPLEVIFRFGMSTGSSLTKRLAKDPDYKDVLGLTKIPPTDTWFDRPVIEFFTKLERKDRHLGLQEAALLSGLNPALFEQLIETTLLIALALHHIFAEKKLELWDGKFEFVYQPTNGSIQEHLLLADSIGPDELRLIYQDKQISKELLRQYYHHHQAPWIQAIGKALDKARTEPAHNWKDICLKDFKESPLPLDPSAKEVIDKLYSVLANHLIGKEFFANQPTLDQLVKSLDKVLPPLKAKN